MGKEIEIKVPLSDSQYESLKKRFFVDSVFTLKKDEYYSRYKTHEERKNNNEPQVIRIRTEKTDDFEKAFLLVICRQIGYINQTDIINGYIRKNNRSKLILFFLLFHKLIF